jgi:hypothetical protein
MEKHVLERLAAIVAAGRLDLPSYFKQCAILGVTFAAAVAAVVGTEAWARADAEKPFASRQYSDFVPSDVVESFSAPKTDISSASTVVAQSTGTWSGAQSAPPWSGKISWSGLQAPKQW